MIFSSMVTSSTPGRYRIRCNRGSGVRKGGNHTSVDHAVDLAMMVLHLHSENGAALVQLLDLESEQDAEFAQFHAALSELEVLFSQFAFACFAQNTSLLLCQRQCQRSVAPNVTDFSPPRLIQHQDGEFS